MLYQFKSRPALPHPWIPAFEDLCVTLNILDLEV